MGKRDKRVVRTLLDCLVVCNEGKEQRLHCEASFGPRFLYGSYIVSKVATCVHVLN